MDLNVHLDEKLKVDMLCLFFVVAAIFIMVASMMTFIVLDSHDATALQIVSAIADMFLVFIMIIATYAIQRGSRLGWFIFIILLIVNDALLFLRPFDAIVFSAVILSAVMLVALFSGPVRRHCNIRFGRNSSRDDAA